MAASIIKLDVSTTKLLEKKKWTGKDLGRLFLAYEAMTDNREGKHQHEFFEKTIYENPDYKYRALEILGDQEKRKSFDEYMNIYSWIKLYRSKAIIHYSYARYVYSCFHEFISVWALQELNHMDFDMAHNSFFTGNNAKKSNSIDDMLLASKDYILHKYYISGFNKAIDIISSIYKVREIVMFNIDTPKLDNSMEEILNFHLPRLIEIINNAGNRDNAYKEKSLKILDDIFEPIKNISLTIPEKKIAEAKRFIKNNEFCWYNNDQEFENILFYRGR